MLGGGRGWGLKETYLKKSSDSRVCSEGYELVITYFIGKLTKGEEEKIVYLTTKRPLFRVHNLFLQLNLLWQTL